MKEKKIVPFTIKMIFLFMLVLLVTEFTTIITYSMVNASKYGMTMWFESIMALLMLLIMLLSGNKYVFTDDREKFGKSLRKGAPILVVSIIILISSIITLFVQKQFNFNNFFSLALLCASIGIFEEFLCRGWLQNEFIERFGKNRSGIIKSIVISSLFFGFMHITNAFAGQSLFDSILQVIQTTGVGLLLGVIYYKTKNIWTCVFLHGFYDFCIMLADINYIKDPVFNGGTIISILSTIFITMFWLFAAIKLLQRSDIKDSEEVISESELVKEKKNKRICTIMMVVTLIATFATDFIIPEKSLYTEFVYETKEITEYTVHYQNYNDFDISYSNSDLEQINLHIYTNDDYKVVIKNTLTNQEVVLDYELFEYTVIQDDNSYGILIYTGSYDEIYYAELSMEDMNNSSLYLESIKDNFKKYDVPELQNAGYITLDNSNEKHPYLLSSSLDALIIIDNEIYVLK